MMLCKFTDNNYVMEAVKLLLNHPSINVNKQCNKGWTALMMACKSSYTDFSMKMVKLILDHPNIDVNMQNYKKTLL